MRGEDSIVPPDKTMDLEWIKALVHESAGIREDVVTDLRTQILRKVYEVEEKRVADKVMQHGLYALTGSQENGFNLP
ncbi:hypothetical protein ACFL6S_18850 [Candidatus Poribacteria bacterium]